MEKLINELIKWIQKLVGTAGQTGARAVEFVDRPLDTPQSQETFSADDRIIGISIKNQGTATAYVSFGSSNPIKRLQADEETEYGNISGGNSVVYIRGFLKYKFDAGTQALVMTVAYDRGPIANC